MKALKRIVRKYYKYITAPWTQPVLSANGTLGGDSFACWASSENGSNYAWHAFDGVITTANSNYWSAVGNVVPADLVFYNPYPLNVTNLRITNSYYSSQQGVTAGIVYASNDNSTWTELKQFTNTAVASNAQWNIDLSNNIGFYKYYKIHVTDTVFTYNSAKYIQIMDVLITATSQLTEETTEQDYDFYEDVDVYSVLKEAKRTYYKTLFESSTPDTYNLEITNEGTYSIEMYGAGGGWAHTQWHTDAWYSITASGGSGSGYKGVLNLPIGNYTVTIGAGGTGGSGGNRGYYAGGTGGATTFGNIISAGGGTGGATAFNWFAVGQGGNVSIIDSSAIVSTTFNRPGVNGSQQNKAYSGDIDTVKGGVSVYDYTHTGYGAGGGYGSPSVGGYCKIVRLSEDSSDYDYYTETSVCKAVKTKR